jgi:hypothetical protein
VQPSAGGSVVINIAGVGAMSVVYDDNQSRMTHEIALACGISNHDKHFIPSADSAMIAAIH